MKRALPALALALVAAALVYVFFVRGSDEEAIRAQLARICETVRVREGSQNPLFYAARVRDGFAEVFDADVSVRGEELGGHVAGRRALADTAVGLAQRFQRAECELSDLDVRIDDARVSAQVAATARLTALGGDGVPRRDERAVTFLVHKRDGTWRVATLTLWPRRDSP